MLGCPPPAIMTTGPQLRWVCVLPEYLPRDILKGIWRAAEHELGKSPALTVFTSVLGSRAVGGRFDRHGRAARPCLNPLLCIFHRVFFSIGSRTTVRRSITPAHLGGKHDSI